MVEVGNLAAQAVYERCGFRREADEVLDYYAVGRHALRMKTSWP
jgi:RimJ/RimL family protein N-acetyltransferase